MAHPGAGAPGPGDAIPVAHPVSISAATAPPPAKAGRGAWTARTRARLNAFWDSCDPEIKAQLTPLNVLGVATLIWMSLLLLAISRASLATVARNAAELAFPRVAVNDTAQGYLTQQQLRDRARMFQKDGFIVLLVCNYGFHDFFTNWALHARDFGHDKHFIAIAEDEASFRYVDAHWPGHAVRLHVEDVERAHADALATAGLQATAETSSKGSASAMDTPEFLLIMYRRLFYLRSLMNAGVDVLLCDVDIAFIRDPMEWIIGSHDLYGVMEIRDPYYHQVLETTALAPKATFYLCGGFLYFRSNPKAYLILDHLLNKVFRAKRGKQTDNDQTLLRFVLLNLQDLDYTPSVAAIPQQRFPPGWLFFGNAEWRKKNFGQVVMIHNNWIRSKQCKMIRWLQYGFWKVPGQDGKIPVIRWSMQNDNGTILGIRDRDWWVQGLSHVDLPYNASECRVGAGIVHKNEIKRRD